MQADDCGGLNVRGTVQVVLYQREEVFRGQTGEKNTLQRTLGDQLVTQLVDELQQLSEIG